MAIISVVKALFDYNPQDDDELTFKEGELLCVLRQDEEDSSWLHAACLRDTKRTGMIPSNYVEPVNFNLNVFVFYFMVKDIPDG